MSLLVKICGITRRDDAQAAVDAGADALGFMFYEPSKRYVRAETAASIIATLPPTVRRVGVFVNAGADFIREIIRTTGIDTLQFHGEELPDFCESFRPLTIWKAFRIENERSLNHVRRFDRADGWLLDSFVPGTHGGSGATFNWDLAVAAKADGRPVILAGGLTPENVAGAVRHVQPFGIDVSSGVESAPGKKDPQKIRAFILAARAATARGE